MAPPWLFAYSLSPQCHRARLARRLALQLEAERSKHARWREENVRRRTDYIPAIFQLLRALADEKQLQPLLDRAIDAKRQKK
jgi:ubiquitin carboxyl-terminal hydrolase L5